MPFSDGLTLSEMTLLVAGCIFFVSLLLAFLWNAMRGQSVKGLLLFFVFPIVMIGFPTIQSVKISADGAEIDNQVTALQRNPNDQSSRQALESNVKDLKDRPFTNPRTLTKIARAQFALGQDADANRSLQRALGLDQNLRSAKDLSAKMAMAGRLSEPAAAETNPGVAGRAGHKTPKAAPAKQGGHHQK